jgi:hypothetical protein
MSADQRSASDAVYVLEAVARLLRVSPHNSLSQGWAEQHAQYLEDIAGAVVRDAGLDVDELAAGRAHVGREWDTAFIPVLFAEDEIESINLAVRGS